MSQLQAQQALAQDQPLVQQQLAALSNSPYGSHLLRNTLQVIILISIEFKYFCDSFLNFFFLLGFG